MLMLDAEISLITIFKQTYFGALLFHQEIMIEILGNGLGEVV